MLQPASTCASGIFGVRMSAMGISSSFSTASASRAISREPLVETITGSTTMCSALYSFSLSAITRIRPAEDTMPIFTASGRISVKIQSS